MKKKKVNLIIYHNDFNSVDFVADVVHHVLGYEFTQAYTCASLVAHLGSYTVKSFKACDKDLAEEYVNAFLEQDIDAFLVEN